MANSITNLKDAHAAIESNVSELLRLAESDARPEFAEINTVFSNIYKKLPEFSEIFLKEYGKKAQELKLDPGLKGLYIVGGRVKGKPISDDSDIDIFMVVENPMESIESLKSISDRNGSDMSTAHQLRLIAIKSLKDSISIICKNLGIPNKFDTLSFGSAFPKSGVLSSNKHMLIGIRE